MNAKAKNYEAVISTKVPASAIPAIKEAARAEFITQSAWVRRCALNGSYNRAA